MSNDNGHGAAPPASLVERQAQAFGQRQQLLGPSFQNVQSERDPRQWRQFSQDIVNNGAENKFAVNFLPQWWVVRLQPGSGLTANTFISVTIRQGGADPLTVVYHAAAPQRLVLPGLDTEIFITNFQSSTSRDASAIVIAQTGYPLSCG